MKITHTSINWILGLQWAFATTAGWIVGFLAGQIAISLFGALVKETTPLIASTAAYGLIVGLFIGTAQWFVLHNQVLWAKWWIATAVVSWAISSVAAEIVVYVTNLFLPNLMNQAFNVALRMTTSGIVTGIMAGVTQWLVMRSQVPHAMWWILSSLIGWSSGFTLAGVFMGYVVFEQGGHLSGVSNALALLAFISAAAIAGGITGLSMWLLLQRRTTDQLSTA